MKRREPWPRRLRPWRAGFTVPGGPQKYAFGNAHQDPYRFADFEEIHNLFQFIFLLISACNISEGDLFLVGSTMLAELFKIQYLAATPAC